MAAWNMISDLRDESDRRGLAIVIELKRSAQPRTVLNRLFKYTQLQTTFGVQMLALVDGEPRLLSLRRALHLYIDHRRTVICRRSEFELEKARARGHILEGLLKALAQIEDVIETIRRADDTAVGPRTPDGSFRADGSPGERDPGYAASPAGRARTAED